MTSREKPTLPPSAADADADKFAKRLATLEQAGRRTTSGLIRALAEAWAEKEVK